MSMDDQGADYEVGYGKPPKATRFKRGQSGNPKGRPKGAKGSKANVKRELETKITVREGDRKTTISKAEAAAKRLVASALKGDAKALSMVERLDADQRDNVGTDSSEVAPASAPDPDDYAILRDFFSEPPTDETGIEDRESDDDDA